MAKPRRGNMQQKLDLAKG